MKPTILAIIAVVVLIGGIALLSNTNSATDESLSNPENVHMVNGVQIIDISVKGGYHPQVSNAKAGMPTIVRFNTKGTYDCSSAVRIPSIGFSSYLQPSSSTDVDLGSPSVSTLQGTCGMGMYSFQINFES